MFLRSCCCCRFRSLLEYMHALNIYYLIFVQGKINSYERDRLQRFHCPRPGPLLVFDVARSARHAQPALRLQANVTGTYPFRCLLFYERPLACLFLPLIVFSQDNGGIWGAEKSRAYLGIAFGLRQCETDHGQRRTLPT